LQAGSAGAGGTDMCDDPGSLYEAIVLIGVVSGSCTFLAPEMSIDAPMRGAVVLDDEGRIAEVLGGGAGNPELVDLFLDDPRWPCYAGQTFKFQCEGAP
jgi:hypothetical protein